MPFLSSYVRPFGHKTCLFRFTRSGPADEFEKIEFRQWRRCLLLQWWITTSRARPSNMCVMCAVVVVTDDVCWKFPFWFRVTNDSKMHPLVLFHHFVCRNVWRKSHLLQMSQKKKIIICSRVPKICSGSSEVDEALIFVCFHSIRCAHRIWLRTFWAFHAK